MPVVGISAIEERAIGSVFATRERNLCLLSLIPTVNIWKSKLKRLELQCKDNKFAIAVYGAFVLDWASV